MSNENSLRGTAGHVRSVLRPQLALTAMAVGVSALHVTGCGGVDPPERTAYARVYDRTGAVVTDDDGSHAAMTGSVGDPSANPQGSPVPSSGRTVTCKVTWRAGSSVCKDAGKTGSCTATWEGRHATLEEAKKECERQNQLAKDPGAVTCECQWEASANNDCYDKCDAIAEKEREKCDKMDPGPGRAKCNQAVQEQWAACYEECRKKK